MISKVLTYLEKHNIDKTPEELFAEFEQACQLLQEFEEYLKANKMKRDLKSLERRRLFAEWFVNKFQGKKTTKAMLMELADMAFVSTRTIEYDLFTETTATAR